MKNTGLGGKVVVVTGAAAGIGRATALRFASEGCRVAAWDVNDAASEELLRNYPRSEASHSFARSAFAMTPKSILRSTR